MITKFIKKIKNYFLLKTRMYIIFKFSKANTIEKKYSDIFNKLINKYQISCITKPQDLNKTNFNNPSIINKDTVPYFEECLKHNGLVALVFFDQKLIFRSCVQKGPAISPFLGKATLSFPENSYYIEFCETDSNFRGQNIYPWVLHEICHKLNGQEIYIGTDIENIPSQKGITKAGFIQKEIFQVIHRFGITKLLNRVNYFGDTVITTSKK